MTLAPDFCIVHKDKNLFRIILKAEKPNLMDSPPYFVIFEALIRWLNEKNIDYYAFLQPGTIPRANDRQCVIAAISKPGIYYNRWWQQR
jgi:hypothetical protein